MSKKERMLEERMVSIKKMCFLRGEVKLIKKPKMVLFVVFQSFIVFFSSKKILNFQITLFSDRILSEKFLLNLKTTQENIFKI